MVVQAEQLATSQKMAYQTDPIAPVFYNERKSMTWEEAEEKCLMPKDGITVEEAVEVKLMEKGPEEYWMFFASPKCRRLK
jgi:hypothetical protein